MASISNIRNGLVIKWEDGFWVVVEFLHVKPGKGGAFLRIKLRNLLTGRTLDQTWRSNVKFEEVRLEKKEWSFSYTDADFFHLMDNETYEIIPFPKSMFEDVKNFMKENCTVFVSSIDDKPLLVELPPFVNLAITQTSPGVKGDTVSGGSKPAVVETGASLQVPLFLNEGDIIKVDTRNGSYIERVSSK